jgi:hypothetical protein
MSPIDYPHQTLGDNESDSFVTTSSKVTFHTLPPPPASVERLGEGPSHHRPSIVSSPALSVIPAQGGIQVFNHCISGEWVRLN